MNAQRFSVLPILILIVSCGRPFTAEYDPTSADSSIAVTIKIHKTGTLTFNDQNETPVTENKDHVVRFNNLIMGSNTISIKHKTPSGEIYEMPIVVTRISYAQKELESKYTRYHEQKNTGLKLYEANDQGQVTFLATIECWKQERARETVFGKYSHGGPFAQSTQSLNSFWKSYTGTEIYFRNDDPALANQPQVCK